MPVECVRTGPVPVGRVGNGPVPVGAYLPPVPRTKPPKLGLDLTRSALLSMHKRCAFFQEKLRKCKEESDTQREFYMNALKDLEMKDDSVYDWQNPYNPMERIKFLEDQLTSASANVKYVKHSDTPSAELRCVGNRWVAVSKRVILSGEQISLDYNEMPFFCLPTRKKVFEKATGRGGRWRKRHPRGEKRLGYDYERHLRLFRGDAHNELRDAALITEEEPDTEDLYVRKSLVEQTRMLSNSTSEARANWRIFVHQYCDGVMDPDCIRSFVLRRFNKQSGYNDVSERIGLTVHDEWANEYETILPPPLPPTDISEIPYTLPIVGSVVGNESESDLWDVDNLNRLIDAMAKFGVDGFGQAYSQQVVILRQSQLNESKDLFISEMKDAYDQLEVCRVQAESSFAEMRRAYENSATSFKITQAEKEQMKRKENILVRNCQTLQDENSAIKRLNEENLLSHKATEQKTEILKWLIQEQNKKLPVEMHITPEMMMTAYWDKGMMYYVDHFKTHKRVYNPGPNWWNRKNHLFKVMFFSETVQKMVVEQEPFKSLCASLQAGGYDVEIHKTIVHHHGGLMLVDVHQATIVTLWLHRLALLHKRFNQQIVIVSVNLESALRRVTKGSHLLASADLDLSNMTIKLPVSGVFSNWKIEEGVSQVSTLVFEFNLDQTTRNPRSASKYWFNRDRRRIRVNAPSIVESMQPIFHTDELWSTAAKEPSSDILRTLEQEDGGYIQRRVDHSLRMMVNEDGAEYDALGKLQETKDEISTKPNGTMSDKLAAELDTFNAEPESETPKPARLLLNKKNTMKQKLPLANTMKQDLPLAEKKSDFGFGGFNMLIRSTSEEA